MASISNIFIDQGATFSTTLTVNDANGSALDLTNYTAIAQYANRLRPLHLLVLPWNICFT